MENKGIGCYHSTKINCHESALGKEATIHQVTARLATSKYVLFPGHIHLLTTRTDDPTL